MLSGRPYILLITKRKNRQFPISHSEVIAMLIPSKLSRPVSSRPYRGFRIERLLSLSGANFGLATVTSPAGYTGKPRLSHSGRRQNE